jgi:hypothetical protein
VLLQDEGAVRLGEDLARLGAHGHHLDRLPGAAGERESSLLGRLAALASVPGGFVAPSDSGDFAALSRSGDVFTLSRSGDGVRLGQRRSRDHGRQHHYDQPTSYAHPPSPVSSRRRRATSHGASPIFI